MTLQDPREPDSIEDVFLQEDLGPSIAEHALQCNQLFRKYMAVPGIAPDPTVMDDQLARFTLWASNMDVFGPLNVSLDYRLRYSPTVVEIIHQLLDTPSRKKQRVSEGDDAEVTKRADDDASDADSNEDQAQDNIALITYNIGGTMARLFRLASAIRKSAKTKRTSRIGRYRDDEEANNAITELRLYTECYIRFRFPHISEALRSGLVEANALRLRRLCYQRSHRRCITLSVHRPQANPRSDQLPQLPKIADGAPAVRFAANAHPILNTIDERSKPTSAPQAPITYATTARQTIVEALYASSTVDVPRAKSVLVNNKLSFPPVPTTSECPYCGVILEFEGASKSMMWNDHVIKDLEPFVCIFAHCTESSQQEPGSLTFETSKTWMSHMQNAHGYAWECRAPSHDPIIFEQMVQYREHSRVEHGVPETHVGTLSNAARRPVTEKIMECPFGDDFQPTSRVESNTVFSSEALYLHIATHMKEIALLALQKLPSNVEDNAEDVDSDQPLEDDGFGYAKLRGSMYSVLDDEALDSQTEAEDSHLNNRKVDISTSVERLDLEDKDASGVPKLHRAVQFGNLLEAQSLIRQGTNLRSRANDGKTALHYASMKSFQGLDMMRLLLESGIRDIINMGDVNGQTPLHYASQWDFTEGMKLIVEYGGDTDATDNYGFSPYLWAVITRKTNATCLLLSLGVDINSTSADGKSALGWAASLGYSVIADILVDKGANVMHMTRNTQMVPLEEAAACGDHYPVHLLLENGADPNHRDRGGWSAIHWAAEEGHLETVKLLLRHGANFNTAVVNGNIPMIEFFLEEDYSINSTDSGRRTALYYAAKKGPISTMNMLLDRGADPNILPDGRRTWEEFILDDVVLSRLRQAGYRKRDTDPETEHQIRLVLKERSEHTVLDRPVSTRSLAPTQKKVKPAGKQEEPRSRMTKIWKRLSGQ
ncbi:hypothetical protein N0V90_001841 [Kalmusia sp. IMI 367209]|nr:hypothetical protein N0V90_001841 [Kalmusia sp. IMI 367209]